MAGPGAVRTRPAWSSHMRLTKPNKNTERIPQGFDGVLQLDGYTGDNRLTHPSRAGGALITVSHCWVHRWLRLQQISRRLRDRGRGAAPDREDYRIEAKTRGA